MDRMLRAGRRLPRSKHALSEGTSCPFQRAPGSLPGASFCSASGASPQGLAFGQIGDAGVAALARGFEVQAQGKFGDAITAYQDARHATTSPLIRMLANNAEAALARAAPLESTGALLAAPASEALAVGASVLAPWAGDGFVYGARVEEIDYEAGTCTVRWDDGVDAHRVVPLAAVTTVHGQVCKRVAHDRPEEVRAWAVRRAMQRTLEEWKAQADAGTTHDAFVDLAGVSCDAAFAEARAVLASSSGSCLAETEWLASGLERARLHLQRARWSIERAYAPDARALAAVCLHRAELVRLTAEVSPPEGAGGVRRALDDVLSLHQRAAAHMAAAEWSQAHESLNPAVWRSAWGYLPPGAVQELLWAKACSSSALSASQRRRRPGPQANSRRVGQTRQHNVRQAMAWAPPEKLVPQQVGLPNLQGSVQEARPEKAGLEHAWRALCVAAGEPQASGTPLLRHADAPAEVLRLGQQLRDGRIASRLLLEVSTLFFALGCRIGRPAWAQALASPLLQEAGRRATAEASGGAADDVPAAVQHATALLASGPMQRASAIVGDRCSPSRASLLDCAAVNSETTLPADLSSVRRWRRWRVTGYSAQQELWVLRLGRWRRAYLAAAPPLSWRLEGLALSEAAPKLQEM